MGGEEDQFPKHSVHPDAPLCPAHRHAAWVSTGSLRGQRAGLKRDATAGSEIARRGGTWHCTKDLSYQTSLRVSSGRIRGTHHARMCVFVCVCARAHCGEGRRRRTWHRAWSQIQFPVQANGIRSASEHCQIHSISLEEMQGERSHKVGPA